MAKHNIYFGATGFIAGADSLTWTSNYEVLSQALSGGEPITAPFGKDPKFVVIGGSIENTRVRELTNECDRRDPILLKSGIIRHQYPSESIYVVTRGYKPSRTKGNSPYHRFQLGLEVIADADTHKRCVIFSRETLANAFSNSGSINIPLPIGATNCSQTIDSYRTTPDGAIPIVENPTQPIIYYDVPETNLTKGNLKITRSGTQTAVDNGLVRFTSQQDQASNKGRILFEAYNGTTWLTFGTIGVAFKSSTGTVEYFDDVVPLVEVMFEEQMKHKEVIRFGWPSSTTKTYKVFAHLTLGRGRPYGVLESQNEGGTITEARCKQNISRTDLTRYTRAGSTLTASGGVYGEDLAVGDTDSTQFSYLDDNGGASALQCGFIRAKKINYDHRANDAGNYWDSLTATFDTLNMIRSRPAPLFIVFCQKLDNTNISIANLVNEAMINAHLEEWVIRVK